MKQNCLKSIKKSWQFRKLFAKGLFFSGNVIRARYKKNALGVMRLGFSVSAKKGNSVERNLFKRRLRQYSVQVFLVQGIDAVIVPLVKLEKIKWSDLEEDMNNFVRKAMKEFI